MLESANSILQKNAYDESKKAYIVRADSSGVVHLDVVLHTGLFLQAGMSIGTIYNDTDKLVVECYLTATDRVKVSIGNEVKLSISGLVQNEYGVIIGELSFIDSDATIRDDQYFFKALVEIESETISSSKNTIDIRKSIV